MRFVECFMLGAAAFAAALAISCSGKDDAPSRQDDPATSTATAAATASPTASASASARPSATPTTRPGVAASPTATNAASREGRDSLLKGLTKLDEATYHAVYTMTLTEPGGTYEGAFAMASSGEKSFFYVQMDSAEGNFIFATVNDGVKSYFCLGDGDDPAESACFEGDDDGPSEDEFPFFNFEEELQQMVLDGEVTVEPAPDRRVGGREAKCWQVTDDTGSGVACVSKADGFLVLIDGDFDDGHVTMALENYTDNPQDTVFEPPFPVQSFGSDYGE